MNLVCAHCGAPVAVCPTSGRLPYWCSRCGTDLKTRAVEHVPELAAAATAPIPLELAALPPDYSKKWSPSLPNKPKVPARPATTEVCAKDTPPPAAVPTPRSAVPANASPRGVSLYWRHRTALFIMTLLFLALSGFQTIRSVNMAIRYRQTDGKVIGFEEVRTRQRTGVSTAVYPVVAYQVGGKTYKTQGTNSTGPIYGYYQVGQTVKVRYLPGEPGNGGIDSFRERWLGPIITGVLGLAAFTGWFVMRFWRKDGRLLKSVPATASPIPSATP